MENKNLPIKLFKKRDEVDDRRTEGMSNDELPKWAPSREQLLERSTQFISVMDTAKSLLQERRQRQNHLPAIMKVTLNEKAIAKSHRSHVGKIFNVSHKFNFVGMSDECDLLVKVDNIQDVDTISRNLRLVDDNAHGLASIDKINLYRPYVETQQGGTLKARLFNYNDYNLNRIVEQLFRESLELRDIDFKKVRYADDLTIYKLENVTIDQLHEIENFEALYSITPMPKLTVGMDFVDADKTLEVKLPIKGVEYPVVGILDSGIQDNEHLKPWLLPDSFSPYPEDLMDKSHGTFVAGIVVYGDELENKPWTGIDGCMLYSATVFPDLRKESIDEDQLIENIREAINSRPDIKIWNLSGGLKVECDLHDFSDFGKFLDNIQQKNDIIICKSAGNCQNFIIPATPQRIPKSADTLRSLVVGSIAHAKSATDIAEIDWPSPFSRTGFGPNHLIKPDVTHYGGNAGKSPSGHLSTSGVYSFATDGKIVSNVGTSFSTPRITALTAGLDHKIAENFNTLLLKALIVHSAKYPSAVSLNSLEKIKSMGYGLPDDVNNILYNSPNEITLILQDTITKGSYYEILDFPYPTDMVENGLFYGEVTITLVASPLLDSSSATEYCQSNIDLSFGTYDKVKERDISMRHILNEFGPDGAVNLLREALYSKRTMDNPMNRFSNERVLRNYGKKFHPLKKYAIDLAELTESNAIKALTAPKKWFFRLEGLFNAYAEAKAADDDSIELSQEFCAIVTIRDRRYNREVYNAVSRQLDSNNFISQNIKLRNEVNIRYGGGNSNA
ncbi:S8 family peptidase [Mucilaginibacter jinjuensis]|uniref:S8 family peptidase n=1 Tax=Mucilaginibacter jinjuensis TaxID=1176721 RepID=A0ABY7T418_9SPHI|nr:S8 family peptidase [Mucilaginibacter jinjuensis]WCT11034.1 S8 family peptidase [Mucilaginibacter jinjuensis]